MDVYVLLRCESEDSVLMWRVTKRFEFMNLNQHKLVSLFLLQCVLLTTVFFLTVSQTHDLPIEQALFD